MEHPYINKRSKERETPTLTNKDAAVKKQEKQEVNEKSDYY